MNTQPFVSVVTPVYNGSKFLAKCLDAISASTYKTYEIIVVDDSSTDNSAEIARKKGATVFQLSQQSGPAAARNYAAKKARGNILFFVDADVLIQKNTIARMVTNFNENPDIVAVFGSYDDKPEEGNFLSQYKNLTHHFIHQQSDKEAATFWAGCGAIRKEVFHKVGGYDQDRYPEPSIEDIELGYRIKRNGLRIMLDKVLQVKHLKQWRFGSLLRADILCRAVPWSKLILESRERVNDLNLRRSHKISTALTGLSLGMLLFSFFEPRLLYCILLSLSIILILNYKYYSFFLRLKGAKFTALVFPMHLFHYFYSGVSFLLCWSKLQ